MKKFYENEIIDNIVFNEFDNICEFEFHDCTINNVSLFEKSLRDCIFNNCTFSNTDLSMCTLFNCQLNNVKFDNCKILGVSFSNCQKLVFEVNFKNCILDFCSFETMKMQNTDFSDCSMKGIDFTGSNLEKSKFINTDLLDSIFHRTNLKSADLGSAFNFSISPNENNIKKAIFSEHNLIGLLHEFDIKII